MITFYFSDWFLDSIKAVINDKGFQLPAQPAKSARETATKLITLSQTAESQPKFSAFAEQLFMLWATGNHGKRERERKGKRERKTGKGRQMPYWYVYSLAAADSDDPRGNHY